MSDQRYIVMIRIYGVMHKESSTMFMASVSWSDQCKIVVYRSFQDFKKLHEQLEKVFCPEKKLFRRSSSVLPAFTAWGSLANLLKMGPSRIMHRLKFLQKYCTELLSCDPRVSQSSDVTRFFLPNTQDIRPDFTSNSIVTMLSEDTEGGKVGSAANSNGKREVGLVSEPFITETYRCVASYATKDIMNRPFKVDMNGTVDVLIKDQAGWWLVENIEKRLAWFPAPYLEKCEEDEEKNIPEERPEEGMFFYAARSYTPKNEDELLLNVGSLVEVLQKSNNGWWLIRYNGKVGHVPSMYLLPYKTPQIHFVNWQKEVLGSRWDKPRSAPSPELSKSQGNLQLTSSHPGGDILKPEDKHKSHSLNRLSEYQPKVTTQEQEDRKFSVTSEFSLTDDCSSQDRDSLDPSLCEADWLQRGSRTPPPAEADRRHLCVEKLLPSRSEPCLFKTPTNPKVPPRPQNQEILSRCTTITRETFLKAQQHPENGPAQSR